MIWIQLTILWLHINSLIDCKVGDNNDLHQRKFLVTITNCYNEIHRLYQVPKGVVPNGLRVNCSQCKGLLVQSAM